MTDFDRLGEDLRGQMHAVLEDLNPSPELMAKIDAIPSARHALGPLSRLGRVPRRFAVALPVPVAAAVAAVIFLFGGSGVTPSYAKAIVLLPNGDVRVTVSQIFKVASANAELRAYHIHNMVVRPMSVFCPDHPPMSYSGAYLVPAPRITLTPRTVARGFTIVIAAEKIGHGMLKEAIGRFRGPLPKCISSHGTGPGLP